MQPVENEQYFTLRIVHFLLVAFVFLKGLNNNFSNTKILYHKHNICHGFELFLQINECDRYVLSYIFSGVRRKFPRGQSFVTNQLNREC